MVKFHVFSDLISRGSNSSG
uniref:Uncharacterized protein n=1 Tax=Anguilla anguilla TaxID=7936 RepID=A0A0E9Y1Q3_ANGAN